MGCISNSTCNFCDARCAHYMMDERLWKKLCEEFNKWCDYEEVKGLTYVEGRNYINPAIRPIFDQIAATAWEEVTRL